MNIFSKVTIKSLRKNKVRTIVTIIGIMLSAAMICAVTSLVASVRNYVLENEIYKSGSWHGSVNSVDAQTLSDISSSSDVSKTVYSENLGYALAEGCLNENKPYLYIMGVSKDFREIMPVHMTFGKYPSSPEEIILPEHLAENGGVIYKIGDTLSVEIGDRISGDHVLGQNNPFYTDDENYKEELTVKEKRTYTVVGFYERPGFENYTAPGYTAITLNDNWERDNFYKEDSNYSVWFKMKDPKKVYDFIEQNEINGFVNSKVLTFSGISRYNGINDMLTGLAAIVIGLIIFGSVSLIYNAFSISVSERTKQFGLLSSIGATKRQLRHMVLFEALAVGAIGIPLGILAGVGGIGVTLMIIGSKFSAFMGFGSIPLRVSVSFVSILCACVIALVTVLISAWIPSKRATKVSAVEAIRQNYDIQVKEKHLKTSKITYKIFGLSGMLASKQYKRNRKRYRATVVSLFMSIVLFVSTSSFTAYLTNAVSVGFSTNGYDIVYMAESKDIADISNDELLSSLCQAKSITKGVYSKTITLQCRVEEKYLNEEFAKDYGVERVRAAFVNDTEFESMLEKYGLDKTKYMNADEPLAIAFNKCSAFDSEKEKYIFMDILKSDESIISVLPDDSTEEIVLRSGKLIDEAPIFVNEFGGLSFIYPESLRTAVIPEKTTEKIAYEFMFTSENHSESVISMKQILNENGLKTSTLIDYAENADTNRNFVIIIQVFSYGFIALISLIAAANVFNTISTNIHLRRREFAMLKSVGMTSKGFNRMMNFECLLYGTKALLFGLPVSVAVTYLIYLTASSGYTTGFYMPWYSIGIAVLSVFAVVFATMMYSMHKIKKDNPIDALKAENL